MKKKYLGIVLMESIHPFSDVWSYWNALIGNIMVHNTKPMKFFEKKMRKASTFK